MLQKISLARPLLTHWHCIQVGQGGDEEDRFDVNINNKTAAKWTRQAPAHVTAAKLAFIRLRGYLSRSNILQLSLLESSISITSTQSRPNLWYSFIFCLSVALQPDISLNEDTHAPSLLQPRSPTEDEFLFILAICNVNRPCIPAKFTLSRTTIFIRAYMCERSNILIKCDGKVHNAKILL